MLVAPTPQARPRPCRACHAMSRRRQVNATPLFARTLALHRGSRQIGSAGQTRRRSRHGRTGRTRRAFGGARSTTDTRPAGRIREDSQMKAIYSADDSGDGEADPEAVPGLRPKTDATSSLLEVDGEIFAIRSSNSAGTDYTWLSGPDPGCGFGSFPARELSLDEHRERFATFWSRSIPTRGTPNTTEHLATIFAQGLSGSEPHRRAHARWPVRARSRPAA